MAESVVSLRRNENSNVAARKERAAAKVEIRSRLDFMFRLLAVVVEAEVGDETFAHDVAESVFELHVLDEQVVLGVDAWGRVRVLEVETQPLLNAHTA